MSARSLICGTIKKSILASPRLSSAIYVVKMGFAGQIMPNVSIAQ